MYMYVEGRPEAVVVGACMERQGDSEGGEGGDRDEQGAASISGWPLASGGPWDHKIGRASCRERV